MNKWRLLLTDWKFIYKLLAFTIGFALIIIGWVLSVFIQYWYVKPNDINHFYYSTWLENLDIMISFWSVQTLILSNIWFLFALIYHKREQTNIISKIRTQLNITIYITVTFIIFWTGVIISLFTNYDIGFAFAEFPLTSKIIGALTHFVIPISMITYLFIEFRTQKITFKNQLLSVMIYPTLYLVYVLIRASILIAHKISFPYPYDFINFTAPFFKVPIFINACLMILMYLVCFFLLLGVYYLFNNIIYKKLNFVSDYKMMTKSHKNKIKLSSYYS